MDDTNALLRDILEALKRPVPDLIPHGMSAEYGGKLKVERVVESALKPSDWVHQYLDEHSDIERRVGQPGDVRYEDLTEMITAYAGMHVPKTTVYRIVKKRLS